MEQDLLLLQILKVPVIIIKFLAKTLSVLTYLPNYVLLFVVDHFLFSEQYSSTLIIYGVMWLPKIALLVLAFSIFCFEFYGVYSLLQVQEHNLYLQIAGVTLAFSGLLILMRKGYLSMIEKYNLNKLKSVKEHIQMVYFLSIDILNIILALTNMLLVVNLKKTFQYEYIQDTNYGYLRHIFDCIRQSFFYVKIFFKVFPWRFKLEMETYSKEKEENNVLNCLVLLTLTYLFTISDLLFISSFGIFNIIHCKRSIYLYKLKATHIKCKVTFSHFCFAFLQSLQVIAEVLMLPICWAQTKFCLRMLISQHQKLQDLFGSQFRSLLIKCMIRIPYFICNIFIFVLQYKYKRRDMLVQQFRQKNKDNHCQKEFISENHLIIQYKTFQCFSEQVIDSFCLVPIVLGTLLKPWKIYWLKYLIDKNYQLQRTFIVKYFFLAILQLLFSSILVLLNVLIFLYRPKKPLDNYNQTINYLRQSQISQRIKTSQSEAQVNRSMQMWCLADKSWLFSYIRLSLQTLKGDIRHLPLYFILKITFLSIFWNKIQPLDAPSLLHKLYKQYYYLSVVSLAKGSYYSQMSQRMKAEGKITCQQQDTLFWKKAYRLERIILIQKIICVFLKGSTIQKIKNKFIKGNNLSQFSNQYWYQYQLMKAYFLRLVYLILEIIISLVGFLFLLPLTLWRLPTFIKIYSFHKNKSYFLKILFSMYKQMWKDLKYLPLKMIAIIIAPLAYLKYIRATSFEYGSMGIDTFQKYQHTKKNCFFFGVFLINLVKVISAAQVCFIYLTWIRIKSLRVQLRRGCKWNLKQVFRQYIFKGSQIPDLQKIIQLDQKNQYPHNVAYVTICINQIFLESLADFPYLIVIALLLILMPWRVNYILQAIKDTRDDSHQRKSFLRLFRNVFKDYACILLNIVLLLSGFKTSKALLLIKRNYRLNFFIGFLQYSYFQELIKEMKALFFNYMDVAIFLIACVFGWTRAHILVKQLKQLYFKEQAEKEEAAKNKKIFQNTTNKAQLQLINRMGYYNYLNVCSYLSIADIISLRSVDKLNYQMSKRQQIWFTKWEILYNGKHNLIDEDYEIRCKKAFGLQNLQNPRVNLTYHLIIAKHFVQNVTQETVNISDFCKQILPQRHYSYFFIDYTYQNHQGYGPQNQLPQGEFQDQQFLRMTNQVRRQKVELDENSAYCNWLFFKPAEKIVQFMHANYRVDTHRKKKQILLVFIVIAAAITNLLVAFRLVVSILWLQDSLIGIRLLLIGYLVCFQSIIIMRVDNISLDWVSIEPFDIYWECVKFWRYFVKQIFMKKMVDPTSNLIKKILAFIKKFWLKMISKLRLLGQKAINVAVKYSVMAYEKVIKPLYLKIADVIRKMKNFFVLIFKKVFLTLRSIINGIYYLISSFFKIIYNGIHALLSSANKLYYTILKTSMQFLLKFGLFGNLLFTLLGLVAMTLPTIIWWTFYSERWYLIVSSIHTMALIVVGYKHLNKIRLGQ